MCADDVLDLLTSLVDKSLVVYEDRGSEGRYRLLETIRQFAQEHLQVCGEREAIRRRHAECYLALAEQAGPHHLAPGSQAWLDRLGREHDNLRSVLGWAIERGSSTPGDEAVEVGLRLGAAVERFWRRRGYHTEGWEWLAQLLALDESAARGGFAARRIVRANALNAVAWLGVLQGDKTAEAYFHESLSISTELGERSLMASVLRGLGAVAAHRGDFASARAYKEESLAICRELGDRQGIATVANNLGIVAREQGDLEGAVALLEESLGIRREMGDTLSTTHQLGTLGTVRMMQGHHDEARACFEESLAIARRFHYRHMEEIALHFRATLARYQGEIETARSLYQQSLRLNQISHNRGELIAILVGLGCVAVMRGERAAQANEGGNAGFARGARLFGAAEALREATGWVIWSYDRPDHERCVAVARAALGEAAFAAARAEGRAMSLEQVCAAALEDGPGEPGGRG